MTFINLRIEYTGKTKEDLIKQLHEFEAAYDMLQTQDVKAWDILVANIIGDVDAEYKIHQCEWED